MSNRQAARASAAQSEAQNGPARPVADNDVDTSVLDKLIEITRQQRQLDEFRTRAEAKKGKVDAAVYRRVVDDYDQRDAALDKEAQPLKAQARQEFEKLRALFDAVNGREERARYDKQELEFRHEVGEMDGTQLAAQLKAPEAILLECRTELEALGGQKARFLEAFDEEELAQPARDIKSAPAANVPATTGKFELPNEWSDNTMMGPRPEVSAVSPGTQKAQAVAPPPPAAPEAPAAVDHSDEYTFVLPEGSLVSADPSGGKQVEYRLSAINYIGRSDENQIRITSNGVSRRHAIIVADKTAFIIRDLKSQNGTFVNDSQIDERTLADGDSIKLGDALLVFKIHKRGA